MGNKEIALARFEEGFSCSQAVFSAYAEGFGLDRKTALKIAGAFGGGMGRMAQTCGVVSGAFMIIGLKSGATDPEDKESKEKTYQLVQQFVEKFKARNGSILCKDLLGQDISTPAGHRLAKEQELFSEVCPKYVKDAAEIIEEVISVNNE